MNLKSAISRAAEAGDIALSQIEGGEDFSSVSEWLEYASNSEIEDVAITARLIVDEAGDIHKINHENDTRRAVYAGICSK